MEDLFSLFKPNHRKYVYGWQKGGERAECEAHMSIVGNKKGKYIKVGDDGDDGVVSGDRKSMIKVELGYEIYI